MGAGTGERWDGKRSTEKVGAKVSEDFDEPVLWEVRSKRQELTATRVLTAREFRKG